MQGIARPLSVYAVASTGVAEKILERPCEDTITLTVTWENFKGGTGTALYTSSWVASKSDVHSQQRFFCMMEKAEVSVDQAHRGYTVAEDGVGFGSHNPLHQEQAGHQRPLCGAELLWVHLLPALRRGGDSDQRRAGLTHRF